MKLAEALCLKEGRKNFQINVRSSQKDRHVYFGRRKLNEELTKYIRQRYSMGMPPKKYIYGLFGAGKTHTLYNIKYQLEESPEASSQGYKVRCFMVEGEFRKKTGFEYLHEQILESIGLDDVKILVQRFLQNHATENLPQMLCNRFGNSNVAKALHNLGLGAQNVTLWKWLCAGKLASSELTTLGLTKNLNTAEEMTSLIVGLSKMFTEENIHCLFLLDELEGLQNVTDDDAQRSFHDAFRKLASDENDCGGFIISLHAGKEEDIPFFIYETDITNRIGKDNIHDLQYLQEEADVEKFLEDLLSLIIDPNKKSESEGRGNIPKGLQWYPFADDAKDQFVDLAVRAPTASLPRNIIKAVNECAIQTVTRDSRIIELEDLGPAQLIFQEES